MLLVDYAASSDEDEPQTPANEEETEQVKENLEKRPRYDVPAPGPSSNEDPASHKRHFPRADLISGSLRPPSSKQVEIVSDQPCDLKLPDASFLLNSPVVPSNLLNVSDHSSRVAAAMAECAARKRGFSGPISSCPHSKVPKGTLPLSKSFRDTVGSHLLPPQLAGRSNIVTEDINKLFVRKHSNASTE